jgi:hypothetical protein
MLLERIYRGSLRFTHTLNLLHNLKERIRSAQVRASLSVNRARTWYHNLTILDKLKNPVEREWYIRQTV